MSRDLVSPETLCLLAVLALVLARQQLADLLALLGADPDTGTPTNYRR